MKGKNAPRYAGPVHSVAEVLAEPRRGKPLRAMVLAKRLCAHLPGNAASIRRLLLGPKPSIPKFSVLAAISVETTERESVAFDKVGASLAVAFLRSRQRLLSLDCWMAGDLLGDHVHVSVGYPALISLIDSRVQPAAFRGAIHGLKMISGRVDSRRRRFIVGELKGLALLHGNRGVRVSASVALYSLGEQSAGWWGRVVQAIGSGERVRDRPAANSIPAVSRADLTDTPRPGASRRTPRPGTA